MQYSHKALTIAPILVLCAAILLSDKGQSGGRGWRIFHGKGKIMLKWGTITLVLKVSQFVFSNYPYGLMLKVIFYYQKKIKSHPLD